MFSKLVVMVRLSGRTLLDLGPFPGLDLLQNCLCREAQPVALRPQAFAVSLNL